MRVFVTGATGWVGFAVVEELLAAGHDVLGLSRSEAGAAKLEGAGAKVHRGSLEDLDSLRTGAAAADGVIHTAFNHDFSKFAANSEEDRRAIEALGGVLEGSERPLLVSSGLALIAPGRMASEADVHAAPSPQYPRASEAAVDAVTARGIRAAAVRLAPSVHGRGDHGFVPQLIALARQTGVSAYVGDGENRWPAVHRLDAARLYRLALERGATGGPYHAVAEQGVPFRQIAEAIGRGLNLPVVTRTPEEAAAHFGFFVRFAGMDVAASSERTQAALGWSPRHPGLIEDIENAGYLDT